MSRMSHHGEWGFLSSDGSMQLIRNLNVKSLEYAGSSLEELRHLLEEKIAGEKYEQCADIRDEISRRTGL
jgi:uncharacterized protein (DUF1810 family)